MSDWYDLVISIEYLSRRGLAGEIAQYARDHLKAQRLVECTTLELEQILEEMRRRYPVVDEWIVTDRTERVL